MKLEGHGIVITGGSEGLGLALAHACLAEGAHVVISARREGPLKRAHRELASSIGDGRRAFALACDVSEPRDAERLIRFAGRVLPRWDGIVNNAAIHGPIGLTEEVDVEAWLAAIRTNLCGTMLCCRYAIPVLRRKGYGKIVNLSGGGAAAARPRFSAYAASKAAVVRFTETLAEEVRGSGIDVNAVAPGALNTRLLDEVLSKGPAAVGPEAHARALAQKQAGGAALEKAVALCVYLLSHASDGITGKLISAVWDPWATLQQKRQALERSDIYTLRRIVPRDRGMDWDRESQTIAGAAQPPESRTTARPLLRSTR